MARVLIVAGLLALAFTVFAVVDCALADRSRIRGLPRWGWILVSLVLPVVGGVLWFLIGSGRRGPATRYVGPDDDPDFLRSRATSWRRPAPAVEAPADDDRWQQLEQELAALDSEADPDDEGDARRR